MIQQQQYKIIYLPGYSLGHYLPWQKWKTIQCPSVGWISSGTSAQWKTKQRGRASLVCDMEWLPGYADKWKRQGMKQNTCDLRNRRVEKYWECLTFGKQNNIKFSQKKKGFPMTEERKQRWKHGFSYLVLQVWLRNHKRPLHFFKKIKSIRKKAILKN